MKDLEYAKTFLKKGYTCAICSEEVYTSFERGIKPLLEVLNSDMVTLNAVAADKVVGKAAAFLYRLMKIKALYALTISEPALSVLKDSGIEVEYETLVSSIQNRAGTGRCPMETAVWETEDADKAYEILQNKVREGL